MKRLGLTLACVASPVLAGTVVFDRVDPVEVRTGVMRLRTVEAPLVQVPDLLDEGAATWEEARFTRLYAIEFALETRRRSGVELEERGVLYLAVRTSSDALLELDERIHALLASLGPDAFVSPLAGLNESDSRFLGIAEISVEPSWSCATRPGWPSPSVNAYQRQTAIGPDGKPRLIGTGVTGPRAKGQGERICGDLRLAVQGSQAEELRTMPAPRELHELRLELEEASTLPHELRPDELPRLPRGVEISRRKVPGVTGGGSISPDHSRGTRIHNEIEWVAITTPTELPPELLSRGAYVSRWSIRERERRLGPTPKDEVQTVSVRTVAYLPITPALLPEEGLPPTIPVELNAELLREDIAHEFDVLTELDTKVLEWALTGGGTSDPEWLRSEGWMMVVCREDGTAWFALPPTSAQSPVTNAPVFCAAMERMLPSR